MIFAWAGVWLAAGAVFAGGMKSAGIGGAAPAWAFAWGSHRRLVENAAPCSRGDTGAVSHREVTKRRDPALWRIAAPGERFGLAWPPSLRAR